LAILRGERTWEPLDREVLAPRGTNVTDGSSMTILSSGGGSDTGPTISVVVPTWNEAPWLPVLLNRLEQCPSVAEVIVADHGSVDGTRDIAIVHGCTVVEGGRPAVGRNAGAAVATSELILFVDADVALTSREVRDILAAFVADPRCSLVHLRLVPATRRRFVRLCYWVVHLYAAVGAKLRAHQGSAPLICVRREVFLAVEGFDERVTAAEDVDLIRRVRKKCGGVTYLHDTRLTISARRLEVESLPIYVGKCIMWAALRALGFRFSIWPYSWTAYPDEVALNDEMIAYVRSPVSVSSAG